MRNYLNQIKKDGYSRIRLNGDILSLDETIPPLDRQKWHNVEIVVDRIQVEKSERSRLFEGTPNCNQGIQRRCDDLLRKI